MVRDATEPGGRDRFSCTVAVWDLCLELGEGFGWQPQGTTYVQQAGTQRETSTRHDYRPGSSRDYKRIEAADAIDWAAALDRANDSPHLAAMLAARPHLSAPGESEPDTAAAHLRATVSEFIEYAYGGAFSFAATHD